MWCLKFLVRWLFVTSAVIVWNDLLLLRQIGEYRLVANDVGYDIAIFGIWLGYDSERFNQVFARLERWSGRHDSADDFASPLD